MMSFELAMTYLAGDEGRKFVNDPRDSGGPTKCGITLKAYQDYLGRPVSAADIAALTDDQIKQFYLVVYWNPMRLTLISSAATAIAIFDSAVLYWRVTAVRLAQSAANDLRDTKLDLDGVVGDETVHTLNACDEEMFLSLYHTVILNHIDEVIAAHPEKEIYRQGWSNRADRLLTLTDLTPLIEETTKQGVS